MEEYHKIDKSRISIIGGDSRSVADMEMILGMPLPEINVKLAEPKKKSGKVPDAEKIRKLPAPAEQDRTFYVEFGSREAAKEFTGAFNWCLLKFHERREREYEVGEMTYHQRGERFFHMYGTYCERHGLKMKKASWDGDGKVKISFQSPSSRPERSAGSVSSEPSLKDQDTSLHLTLSNGEATSLLVDP